MIVQLRRENRKGKVDSQWQVVGNLYVQVPIPGKVPNGSAGARRLKIRAARYLLTFPLYTYVITGRTQKFGNLAKHHGLRTNDATNVGTGVEDLRERRYVYVYVHTAAKLAVPKDNEENKRGFGVADFGPKHSAPRERDGMCFLISCHMFSTAVAVVPGRLPEPHGTHLPSLWR